MSFRVLLFQTAAVLSLTGALSGIAQAQESVPSSSDVAVCYGRIYDDQHMRSHPRQKVVRIFLFYGSPSSQPNEEPDSEQGDYRAGPKLMTTLRGEQRPDWTWGFSCQVSEHESKPNRCIRECDRTLGYLAPDGKGSVILSDLDRDLYHGPDDADVARSPAEQAEFDKKTLGEDDSKFRLTPLSVEACKAEFAKIDPVDPALGEPLRKRLKPDQPFCYGRDYDAAHLAKHPEQETVSIRVQRGPTELAAYAAANGRERWPENAEVVVTLTTRKGAGKIEQKYACGPEGNQWRCYATTSTSLSCDTSNKEIFLRRGTNGTRMLGNPNSSLPPVSDFCGKSTPTKSDDKVFRLGPLPLSACGL